MSGRQRGVGRARAAAWAFSFVVALGSPIVAVAQPAPPSAAAAPSIEIFVVAGPEVYDRLRALLDRRLSALGATSWSRAEEVAPGDVLATSPSHALRCWIDLSDRRRARLTFAARSGERFLVRDFELSGDLDEIDRAALAEVIELSIGALLEDERAGLSRGETQALLARRAARAPTGPAAAGPAPPLPTGGQSPLLDAPAPVLREPRLDFGVFYAAQAVAAGLPIDNGPGLSLAISQQGSSLFGRAIVSAGWLTVQYLLPETVSGAAARVGLEGVAARLGVEIGSRRWRLRVGAGWDFVHVSPEAESAALALVASHWSTTLSLQGAARAAVARLGGARLWVNVLADLLPTAVDYGVAAGGSFQTVFSPWRVRPGIALEVTFR